MRFSTTVLQSLLGGLLFMFAFLPVIQAQSVCSYSIDCPDTPVGPECECEDQPFGYIVALDEGDLEVKVNMSPEPYSCCGESFGGSIFFRGWLSNGLEVMSGEGTHVLPCVAKGDTLFFQFTGSSGSYTISSAIINIPSKPKDEEPEDDTEYRPELSPNELQEGRVGYGVYHRDDDDFYRIIAPEDGDLHVELVVDRQGGMALFRREGGFDIGNSSSAEPDTHRLSIPCLAAGDELLVLVTTGDFGCTGYSLRYWLDTPDNAVDAEPNEGWDNTLALGFEEPAEGHLGFGIYGSDNGDWYDLICPADGDLKISAVFEKGGGMGLFDGLSPFNFLGAETFEDNDTISMEVSCVQKGDKFTLIMSRNPGECTGYEVRAEISGSDLQADMDMEEGITNAIELTAGEFKSGHIGYGYFNNDWKDTYRIRCPENGNLQIQTFFAEAGRINLLDSNGTFLDFREILEPGNLTFDVGCVEAGSVFYLETLEIQGRCSAYEVGFSMTDSEVMAAVDITDVQADQDGAIDLTVSGGTAPFNFLWNTGATDEDLAGLDAGIYSVTITDANHCTLTLDSLRVDLTTSTQAPLIEKDVLIYPNPTSDFINITFQDTAYLVHEIDIFSPDGKVLLSKFVRTLPQKPFISLDLSSMTPGLYLIRMLTNKGVFTSKVLLKN